MPTLALNTGTVDLDLGILTDPERGEIALTPLENAVLGYLSERPNQAVDRADLLVDVFGYSPSVRSRAADDTIKRLRAKIERTPSRRTT